MALISAETLQRKNNASRSLEMMKQIYCVICSQWNRSSLENNITHDTSDEAFGAIFKRLIQDWLKKIQLEEFMDQYTIYWNNTVAKPPSQIPTDYVPDFEVKYYEIEDTRDKKHRDEFYSWYAQTFNDDEHKTYQRATEYYEQWLHQQAFEEFSKLLPKHQWFVRVRFNKVVNGIMSLSWKEWRYNKLFRIANGYERSNRVTQKMIKSYDPEQIWNDAELLRELLKEYKELKKEFPKYEMRKRNRWLQSSMKNFYDLLREVSYECMIANIWKSMKTMMNI